MAVLRFSSLKALLSSVEGLRAVTPKNVITPIEKAVTLTTKGLGATANICSRHEMKLEGVVGEKLGVLFRRFVLFAQNSGDELWGYVRENLVVLFRRFLLFAWDIWCNRESHNNCEPRPKVEWPYVMNSSVAMQGPLISVTWIWYHLHRHWHHGYYRARR